MTSEEIMYEFEFRVSDYGEDGYDNPQMLLKLIAYENGVVQYRIKEGREAVVADKPWNTPVNDNWKILPAECSDTFQKLHWIIYTPDLESKIEDCIPGLAERTPSSIEVVIKLDSNTENSVNLGVELASLDNISTGILKEIYDLVCELHGVLSSKA